MSRKERRGDGRGGSGEGGRGDKGIRRRNCQSELHWLPVGVGPVGDENLPSLETVHLVDILDHSRLHREVKKGGERGEGGGGAQRRRRRNEW